MVLDRGERKVSYRTHVYSNIKVEVQSHLDVEQRILYLWPFYLYVPQTETIKIVLFPDRVGLKQKLCPECSRAVTSVLKKSSGFEKFDCRRNITGGFITEIRIDITGRPLFNIRARKAARLVAKQLKKCAVHRSKEGWR
jgi:hypothetical protein